MSKLMSRKASTAIGCLWLSISMILILLQIVFLTMKLTGAVSWSWWAVLIPIWSMAGLPLAIVVIAVIILAPKLLINEMRIRKRVEAEARKFGMERQPGESTIELKKRIVRRNMITGNYSHKDIKDALMEAFPALASVQFRVDNQNNAIKMKVRKEPGKSTDKNAKTEFTDEDLRAILKEAAKYIPLTYTIAIEQAKEEKHGDTES